MRRFLSRRPVFAVPRRTGYLLVALLLSMPRPGESQVTYNGVLASFGPSNETGPQGRMVQASDGKLYGTTVAQACCDWPSSLFSFDPATGAIATLHVFGDYVYGGALLLARNGKLYGTRTRDNAGNGSIYSF